MFLRRLIDWLGQTLELSHGSNTPLRSMEGLRGVAVFLVFLVHYSSLMAPWITGSAVPVSHFVHAFGNIGVDLFFVLSGYLIYGSVLNRPTFAAGKYARRRVQRIYPTFLVVLVIYLGLSFALPAQSKLPTEAGATALYIVQNLLLLPGIFDIEPIITVAWSLSYEAFYYLAIPLLIFALRMQAWRVNQRLAFWAAASVAGFAFFAVYSALAHMMMFVSGIVLFELHANKQIKLNKGGTRCLLAAVAVFGLREFWPINYLLCLGIIFVLFGALCLCAFNQGTFAYRWLTYTPLRWLGNMSYSYYLIHGLALKAAFMLLGALLPAGFSSAGVFYWLWAPMFMLTLIVSFALFVAVERPLSLKPAPSTAKA